MNILAVQDTILIGWKQIRTLFKHVEHVSSGEQHKMELEMFTF